MIKNFTETKKSVLKQTKRSAANKLKLVLSQIFKRKMQQNLYSLKNMIQLRKVKCLKIKAMMSHWKSRCLREIFNKYKNNANFASTELDVNENGPVVEDVLTYQI